MEDLPRVLIGAIILKKLGFNVFFLYAVPNYPSEKVVDPKYHKGFLFVKNVDDLTVIRLRLISLKHEGYVKTFFLFSNFVLASIFFMPKILKITGKINFVYSLAPVFFSSLSGYIYSKKTDSFFIYDVANLLPEELVVVKTIFSPIIFRVGKLFARLSYSLPDLILTMSESVKNYSKKLLTLCSHLWPSNRSKS